MKKLNYILVVLVLCLAFCSCDIISDEPKDVGTETKTELDNGINTGKHSTGTRIWDSFHPDDSERNPYFAITLHSLNDAKIEHIKFGEVRIDGENLLESSGTGCDSFYISDLTEDGYPELCFGMNCGFGMIDERIVIIDYTSREVIFTLSDRSNHDYYLFLRDDALCIKETKYATDIVTRTGTISYNGSEIFVKWDSNIDATADRDSEDETKTDIEINYIEFGRVEHIEDNGVIVDLDRNGETYIECPKGAFKIFDTVAVVYSEDKLVIEEGIHTCLCFGTERVFESKYSFKLTEYAELRESDPSKGDPLYD